MLRFPIFSFIISVFSLSWLDVSIADSQSYIWVTSRLDSGLSSARVDHIS